MRLKSSMMLRRSSNESESEGGQCRRAEAKKVGNIEKRFVSGRGKGGGGDSQCRIHLPDRQLGLLKVIPYELPRKLSIGPIDVV